MSTGLAAHLRLPPSPATEKIYHPAMLDSLSAAVCILCKIRSLLE
jgi:hypothetical protein